MIVIIISPTSSCRSSGSDLALSIARSSNFVMQTYYQAGSCDATRASIQNGRSSQFQYIRPRAIGSTLAEGALRADASIEPGNGVLDAAIGDKPHERDPGIDRTGNPRPHKCESDRGEIEQRRYLALDIA